MKNKIHFAERLGGVGRRYALCGSDRGLKGTNKIPSSKEWRDVTCKLCRRSRKKH